MENLKKLLILDLENAYKNIENKEYIEAKQRINEVICQLNNSAFRINRTRESIAREKNKEIITLN